MSQSELNGNVIEVIKASDSNEDISQYTDANESISAPIELLAEFLSAVMVKSYKKALDYCKQILLYEPNNATAKEFYPLIMDKIKMIESESCDDSISESSANSSSCSEDNCSCHQNKADSEATSASYSSLEDEEADIENEVSDTPVDDVSHLSICDGNANFTKGEISPSPGKTNNQISTTTVDILIHPSPTVTLKRENTIVLTRNGTYTKNFAEQIANNKNDTTPLPQDKPRGKNFLTHSKIPKKKDKVNFNPPKKFQKKISK